MGDENDQHEQRCLDKYAKYVKQNLTDRCKVTEYMYVTHLKDIKLNEYVVAVKKYCSIFHVAQECSKCELILKVAGDLMNSGIVPLPALYRKHFRSTYKSDKAIRRVIQLPVVIFRAFGQLFVTEYVEDVDFTKLASCVSHFVPEKGLTSGMSRESLKVLCELASSEKERRLIRVAASHGQTGNQARKSKGISNLHAERERVKEAVKEYEEIKKAVNEIAQAREGALTSFIPTASSDSSDSEYSEGSNGESCEWSSGTEEASALSGQRICDGTEEASDMENLSRGGVSDGTEKAIEKDGLSRRVVSNGLDSDGVGYSGVSRKKNVEDLSGKEACNYREDSSVFHPSYEHLLLVLRENSLNWLSFVEELKLTLPNITEEALDQLLMDFVYFLSSSDLTPEEDTVVEQSRQAYLAQRRQTERENAEVTTDSESDDPEDRVELHQAKTMNKDMQEKVKKQRQIFKKYRKRLIAKEVTKRCLLRRRLPKRVSRNLQKYPDIGTDIEECVRENRVGADSWRRTGVLTFTGNARRGPKVTYNGIKSHLEKKYGTRFGYGTIVQLCCARNKRRLSAKRYFGAAKIVSRRARKGFSIKLNVDAHWSCAFYKGLDYLQHKGGLNMTVLNRDDAAGFRLDSTFTHKQHRVLSEAGKPELTTHTDFLNKYTSTL